MPHQLSLPGVEPAEPRPSRPPSRPAPEQRARPHHLFFAVLAEPAAAWCADRLRRDLIARHQLAGSEVRTERLHLTLVSLDWHAEFSEALALWAARAASGVDMPAFNIRLDRFLSFHRRRGNRPQVLCGDGEGVAGFMALYQALHDALQAAWPVPHPVRAAPVITPHMTLYYSPRDVPEHPVEPLCWTVREFQLLYNRLGSGGAYRVLGRWALDHHRFH